MLPPLLVKVLFTTPTLPVLLFTPTFSILVLVSYQAMLADSTIQSSCLISNEGYSIYLQVLVLYCMHLH